MTSDDEHDACDKSVDESFFQLFPVQWTQAVFFVSLGVFLIAGLLWIVGAETVITILTGISFRRLVSLLIVGFTPLILWGFGFHVILTRLGVAGRLRKSVLLVAAANFLNTITPFGQLGGDPPAGFVIKRALGIDFETGLAAIGIANAANRIAAVGLGFCAAGVLGLQLAPTQLLVMTNVILLCSVCILFLIILAWRYRDRLSYIASRALSRALSPLERVPRLTPPSASQLELRAKRFIEAIEILVSSPLHFVAALMFGAAGQLAVAATLWIALAAVGSTPSVAAIVLAIPVAKLSGLAPTPGGIGSAEVLLAAILVALSSVSSAVAGAATVLYRGAAFGVPSIGGALVTVWYGMRGQRYSTVASPMQTDAKTASIPLPVMMLTTGVLVSIVASGIHYSQFLVEPTSQFIHFIRDTALLIVTATVVWAVIEWGHQRLIHG